MENNNSKLKLIEIEKGNSDTKQFFKSKWDSMSEDMRKLVELFFLEKEQFQSKNPLNEIKNYIKKYDRLLYTVISDKIYENFSEIEKEEQMMRNKEEQILRNIDLLLEEVENEIENVQLSSRGRSKEKYDKNKLRTILLKVKDHTNLAIRQYRSLKQTDEEYVEKFNRQIGSFKENVMKEITSQLITLVGIFTAIAFILFGGISSFNNIFSVIKETPTLKLIIVSCLWIVGMSDIVFIFLLGISKMTNLDIGDKISSNILEKYIWIFWFNAIFFTIVICSLWIGFGINIDLFSYHNMQELTKKFIFVVGTIVILVSVYCTFSFLMKKTKNNNC